MVPNKTKCFNSSICPLIPEFFPHVSVMWLSSLNTFYLLLVLNPFLCGSMLLTQTFKAAGVNGTKMHMIRLANFGRKFWFGQFVRRMRTFMIEPQHHFLQAYMWLLEKVQGYIWFFHYGCWKCNLGKSKRIEYSFLKHFKDVTSMCVRWLGSRRAVFPPQRVLTGVWSSTMSVENVFYLCVIAFIQCGWMWNMKCRRLLLCLAFQDVLMLHIFHNLRSQNNPVYGTHTAERITLWCDIGD